MFKDLEAFRDAINGALASDDSTAGEGASYFNIQASRSQLAWFPPAGTQRKTLDKVIKAIGGGHVAFAEVEPDYPGLHRRRALVADVGHQAPGNCTESIGRRPEPPGPGDLAETADGGPADAQPTPAPVPTGSPPPAQGED